MRRFLSTSFIVLTLVISAAGAAPAAHAQTTCTSAGGSCIAADGSAGSCAADPDTNAFYCLSSSLGNATASNPGGSSVDPALAKIPTPFEGGPQMDSAFAKVMNMILSLFAWLLTAAMITLNYAVYYTVIKMGDYVHGLAAVGVTWRILRDIANIMFIFGFLGAGIATILNVDQYGWKTKMLPMLLVGAIFLNFSLFITEAMIDGTNLFATQFYTQINGGTIPTKDTLLNEGISGRIMQQLGLQSAYDVRKVPEALTAKNSLFVAFMGIILFIVTAFVMFSLAFILIARFVALIFFIILCPVAFMGLALPGMQYRAGQWWKNFLEQIITAPVLLLLLYVALAVITDAQFLAFGSSPNWLGLVPGTSTPANMAGFAGMLLSFLIAMGLLLVVVIKAKSMSAFGADGAIKLGGKLSFGATAWAGRRTVGRASNYAARAIRSSKIGRSDMGKLFAGIADKGAKASFDIRGATIGGGLKGINVDAGDVQKGGYVGREAELIKSRIDYAKTLRQTTEEREDSEKASTKKDELTKLHNTRMKPLERREREQLVAVRDASTKELKDQARDALEVTRNEIALEKNEHQTKTSEQDVIIKGNSTAAAQKEYGKALERKTVFGFIPRQPYDWPTAVGSARREASSRIIGEANKDPSLKKLDEIANALGKQSSPAPSSAPTAPAH